MTSENSSTSGPVCGEIHKIICRNNEAIAKIQQGQVDLGISDLREVLRALQAELAVTPSLPNMNDTIATPPTTRNNSTISLFSVQLDQSSLFCSASQQQPNAFPIYRRAFKCACTPGLESASSPPQHVSQDAETLLAIVLFNLGISMHQRGLLRGSKSLLRRTIRLYNMAISLLPPKNDLLSHYSSNNNTKSSRSGSCCDGIFMLTMALYNNQGHIHSYLGELQQARECFFSIQKTIFLILQRAASTAVILLLDEADHLFLSRYYNYYTILLAFVVNDQGSLNHV